MVRMIAPTSVVLALACLPHAALATTPTLEELQAQVEALAAEIESRRQAPVTGAGSTTLGGYGEAYYKRIDGVSPKEEFDAYRLVLFVGHTFDGKVRFGSEIEIEHAYVKDNDSDTSCTFVDTDLDGIVDPAELKCGTPKASTSNGYVAVEQLFLEYKYAERHRAYAGQLLVPVGILNETHEPDTFYGVFRAPVEREIVPGTWFETGVMFSGEISAGLSYDAMVGSGLKNDGSKVIKDARQRGSKADGSDLAYTARLKYTGLPGTEIGVTWHHQADMTQSGGTRDLGADLLEAHVAVNNGPFALRALAAKWNLDKSAMAAANQHMAEQAGWYVEPSFKVLPKLGVFARHSVWDNAAVNTATNADNSEWTEQNVGVNWWLHERAVVKADLQFKDDPGAGKKDQDGFNLGFGFQF